MLAFTLFRHTSKSDLGSSRLDILGCPNIQKLIDELIHQLTNPQSTQTNSSKVSPIELGITSVHSLFISSSVNDRESLTTPVCE